MAPEPRRTSAPQRSTPPVRPGRRWSTALGYLGWGGLVASIYCYDHAKPQAHKIDRFFGVSRSVYWDDTFLFSGLGLGFLALLCGALSVALAFSDSQEKAWRPPLASGLLACVAVGVVIMLALKLA